MRAPKNTIDNARRLRRALSVPEARLWSRLRFRTSGKPVFRRQHPIGPYVLDFYCAGSNRAQRDIRRDAWLNGQGVEVLRVPARELTRRVDEAADAIVRMADDRLRRRAPSTTLLSQRGPPPPLRGEDEGETDG